MTQTKTSLFRHFKVPEIINSLHNQEMKNSQQFPYFYISMHRSTAGTTPCRCENTAWSRIGQSSLISVPKRKSPAVTLPTARLIGPVRLRRRSLIMWNRGRKARRTRWVVRAFPGTLAKNKPFDIIKMVSENYSFFDLEKDFRWEY